MGSAQVKQVKSPYIRTVAVDKQCDIETGINTESAGTNADLGFKPDETDQLEEGDIVEDEGDSFTDQSITESKTSLNEEDDAKQPTLLELSPEEIETYQDDCIAHVQELINKAQSKDSYIDEKGEYISEIKAVVVELYKLCFKLSEVPLAVLNTFMNRLATLAKQPKTLEMICDIVIKTYPEKWLKKDKDSFTLFELTFPLLQNYSDASSDFAIAVADYPGLCEKIQEILRDRLGEHINQSHSAITEDMTSSCLSVVHNLSMVESNIGRLRQVGYIPLLESYLASPKEMSRLSVFASLAGIINEEESEIIKANIDVVKILLNILSEGSRKSQHRYNGWSCKECTFTIRLLARNDANKKLLVEHGALEILVQMGRIGDFDEQYEAVNALWALSFDLDNRMKICNEEVLGVVDLFIGLKDSDDERIRKVCAGALWTLGDDLKSSSVENYKRYAEAASPDHTPVSGGNSRECDGHVMISYQWADQKTLKQIRNQLRDAGIKVWMDIDQMGGSTVESMARAVEQATVVLMCMSQKYKNSQNCRAEAEYAYQKQKTIVPLKMEQGYIPDGWLGFICGAKVFFEFSGKYRFEDKISDLLKEILQKPEKRGEDIVMPVQAPPVRAVIRDADEVDSGPQLASGIPVTMATSANPHFTKKIKTVREWSSEDVKKWVEKNNLKSCGADRMTGSEVALLMRMNKEAPDCFFSCLQDPKKMKQLLNMSNMAWALEDLTD